MPLFSDSANQPGHRGAPAASTPVYWNNAALADAVPAAAAVGCVAAETGKLRSRQHRCREAAISSAEAMLAYAEGFLAEDEPLRAARVNADEVGGAAPVGAAAGAALRFLVAAIGGKAVVEVGTGCGTSGIWLLRGMRPDGVLTSVDLEPEHQRLARTVFTHAGFAANRYRLISGRALDVLPRLTDGGYDMVFCDAVTQEYPDYLSEALRLLRPGGILAFDKVMRGGKVADPAQRDPDTVALREVGLRVRDDERLIPLLLPVGDGLLAAIKRSPP